MELTNSFPSLHAMAEGIVLRPFQAADVPAVATACNDEQIQRWLPLPSPYTRAHAEDWCLRLSHQLREQGDGLHLAMATPAGTFIGCVSLKKTDWLARVTEIGYWAAPGLRSAGHTTAATAYLARWALANGMERVELMAATGNRASQRVAEKAGFRFEGVKRNAGLVHGGRVDLCLYALTPDTRQTADLVADFHDMIGTSTASAEATSAIRRALLAEEYQEYQAAEDARDLAGIADALADMVYVAYGTAHCYGFDMDAMLTEVHASNMTKQPPAVPGGKAVKGPGYRPPDIKAVLGRPGG
jgi:RimJ/RimL family protein N-acetyltransferase/predicted HAD superfamily Cof-like phosphohydrolase